MKLSLATLAASVAVAAADPRSAAARWNNLRRRLSYEKIAGYAPDSQVRHRLIAVASERSICNSRGGCSRPFLSLQQNAHIICIN